MHRSANHIVVVAEGQHGGRLKLGDPHRDKPGLPVLQRTAALVLVEADQRVARQIARFAKRPAGQIRARGTADRHHFLIQQLHPGRSARVPIADGNIDALGFQIPAGKDRIEPVLGGSEAEPATPKSHSRHGSHGGCRPS